MVSVKTPVYRVGFAVPKDEQVTIVLQVVGVADAECPILVFGINAGVDRCSAVGGSEV